MKLAKILRMKLTGKTKHLQKEKIRSKILNIPKEIC
jgi:hypothetical protein